MKKKVMFFLAVFCANTFAFDLEVEEKITKISRERCGSEFKEGEDYTMEILANGDVKVSLIGRKGAGLEGSFVYKKNEWKGKPFVKAEDQLAENSDFRTCVKEQSKELMERYSPEKPKKMNWKDEDHQRLDLLFSDAKSCREKVLSARIYQGRHITPRLSTLKCHLSYVVLIGTFLQPTMKHRLLAGKQKEKG